MKEQKIIKDLKERNIKLKNQYELECIRYISTSLKLKEYKEVIDKVINNLEKDISMIKTIKMSNKEIISRLEQISEILKKVKKYE